MDVVERRQCEYFYIQNEVCKCCELWKLQKKFRKFKAFYKSTKDVLLKPKTKYIKLNKLVLYFSSTNIKEYHNLSNFKIRSCSIIY